LRAQNAGPASFCTAQQHFCFVAVIVGADAGESKDQIEQQYQKRKDELDQQMQQIKAGEAQAIAQATQGVAGAGAGIAAAFDQPKTPAAKGDAAAQSLDKAAKAAEAAGAAGAKPITKEDNILDRLSSEDDIWMRGKVSLT
jgi:hypothetical protein